MKRESDRAAFADLLLSSFEPMFAWRLDGPIEFWNAGAERLYGFTAAEAVGRDSHTLLQTGFPLAFAELRSRLVADGHWSGELLHTCKDGRKISIDSRLQLLAGDMVLEINRDITQFKQVEAALKEREQALRWLASIVESSDDAIISKSLDGVITSWNAGAERIFGYSAEEAVGQAITMVIPPDRMDEERGILSRIRRGEPVDHFETVRQRKDGSLILVSLTVSPVKNAEGRIVGASKNARDISRQKQAQDQIAILAREAEHRSKNMLAIVLATVRLSQAETPKGLKQAIEGRIRALSNVHSLFVATRWIGAELSAIAAQELAPYSTKEGKRVRIEGPDTLLEPNTAQAVAVILHELATNAAKYGALSGPDGLVDLTWQHQADGQLILNWRETGGPAVQTPTRQGFGTKTIELMVDQLKGEARFDWNADGLVFEIALRV